MELFFIHPEENYYLRKVVREIDEEVNAVKRELDILEGGKVLLKERRLNKVFYHLNRNYIFFDEFIRIFTKQTPLAVQISKSLSKLGKVKFIVVSTRFIKHIPIRNDEIYALFVGTFVAPEVASIIKTAESGFIREINYTIMTEEEFNFRKKNNDPFIWRFLRQPKVMLAGTEEELVK